ncbi:LysR family transcriptional regulator [Gilvimarinus algae]|uniref:LysR family transcriptional regulator n=1 Tax=Gilvimarinus algae TaxID=3058037 RepID=A0ABT8TAJ5_9GAMM|nr:LysR family transcriptional regulator [Gilvimarinus sp. SDUM040014]MDO3381134.1 LysR family transcriptional regulator [Gilvimarinus sp. SDUM040014]
MDKVETMRAFVTVVSEGSFTRAADRLALSPQLVSKYVSHLEERLGQRLLNRTTRKLHLTEAGLRYHERAQQLLEELDDLDSQVGDLGGSAQGLLRISAPVSFASEHLPGLLSDFQRAHPGVGIDLMLDDRKVDIVEEGFDIALRIGRLKSSSLIAKRIAPVRLVLCASPDYIARCGAPANLDELAQHRYLRYSLMDSDNPGSLQQTLSRAQPVAGSSMVCNNGQVLMRMATLGMGIVLQPTFIAGRAIAEGKLQILLPELAPEPLGLYAVYAHRKLLASKVRCFLDFIDGYYGDSPYWDEIA